MMKINAFSKDEECVFMAECNCGQCLYIDKLEVWICGKDIERQKRTELIFKLKCQRRAAVARGDMEAAGNYDKSIRMNEAML